MTWLSNVVGERRAVAVASIGAVLAASLAVAQSSHATLRGSNGRLVFQADVGPGSATQLFTINPDGTGRKQVTHFKDSGVSDANWSKGGSRLVFSRHWDPGGPNEKLVVYWMNADGSGVKALPKTGNVGVSPNWFPNGRRIVFLDAVGAHGGQMMVINADGTGLRSAGVPGSGGDSACFLGSTNRIAFLRQKPGADDQQAVFVAGLLGHRVKRVTPWGGYADKIDCSPDGTRIVVSMPAFSGDSGRSSNVYTMKIDGTDLVQLTHENDGLTNAGADSWSPDGTKIAYVSNKAGTYQIWTMNADGTGQKQLTRGPESHRAAWGSNR